MTAKIRKKSFLLWLDRSLSQGLGRQLLILFGLMLAAFVVAHLLLLLSFSDWAGFCERQGVSRWIAPLYLLIDGNAFTSVYENGANKWTVTIACGIYIIGVFIFTGMMVSVITNIIERRVDDHRNGLVHYLISGHYVLMGFDDTVSSFIGHIYTKDADADILLLTSKAPVEVREKLRNSLPEDQVDRIIINYGHRTSTEEYPKIHLEKAKEIFVVGYHGNTAHDAINIECLDSICKYLSAHEEKGKPERITCVFKDVDTYVAFQSSDIFVQLRSLHIEFVPYNYHVGWAHQILMSEQYLGCSTNVPYSYPTLYGNGVVPEDKHFVHLVFVGTTNAAVAIAIEAAHLLHFPNFSKENGRRTLITFIDKNADTEKNEFITRNRHFFEVQPYLYLDLSTETGDMDKALPEQRKEHVRPFEHTGFLDVQFQFIKGDVFSHAVQERIASWALDSDHQYLSLFLAQANHRQNFVMAMNMPDAVYDKDIPVFIRQDRSDNLVTNLRTVSKAGGSKPFTTWNGEETKEEMRSPRYTHLYPFGMAETVYDSNEVYLRQAKLINYLYDTAKKYDYRQFEGILTLESTPEQEIWEKANELWLDLPVALQWSNLYAAYSIDTKLNTLRAMRRLDSGDHTQDFWALSDKEIDILAGVEHNRWNVEKLLMGFRKPLPAEDKYSTSDSEAKAKLKRNKELLVHHDIRPTDALDGIIALDLEFSKYIPWILKMGKDDLTC